MRDPKLNSNQPADAGETDEPVVNYFQSASVAVRYAKDRPSGHARVLEIMRAAIGDHLPVQRALDVGCGTGASTIALLPYAYEIVGVDSSSEMLAQAHVTPRTEYRKAYAEALPFRRGEFDLVTVSSAYHWFDHDRFLGEAARVLRPGGWLVLYKAGTTGRLDDPEFEHWRREVFAVRFPKVARNHEPLTPLRAAKFGFSETACETTIHRQRHTLDEYVHNLLTHSSVIRVTESGSESANAVRGWLRAELVPFFRSGETEFTHESKIHVFCRETR